MPLGCMQKTMASLFFPSGRRSLPREIVLVVYAMAACIGFFTAGFHFHMEWSRLQDYQQASYGQHFPINHDQEKIEKGDPYGPIGSKEEHQYSSDVKGKVYLVTEYAPHKVEFKETQDHDFFDKQINKSPDVSLKLNQDVIDPGIYKNFVKQITASINQAENKPLAKSIANMNEIFLEQEPVPLHQLESKDNKPEVQNIENLFQNHVIQVPPVKQEYFTNVQHQSVSNNQPMKKISMQNNLLNLTEETFKPIIRRYTLPPLEEATEGIIKKQMHEHLILHGKEILGQPNKQTLNPLQEKSQPPLQSSQALQGNGYGKLSQSNYLENEDMLNVFSMKNTAEAVSKKRIWEQLQKQLKHYNQIMEQQQKLHHQINQLKQQQNMH